MPPAGRAVAERQAPATLSDTDRRIINALQGGFPLGDTPYRDVAEGLGMTETALLARLEDMLARRVLTRFGPMYHIERMGGRFVLAAMAVPESRFEAVSAQVNALPEVAHNYRREHALNMWFVVAAPQRDEIATTLRQIEHATGLPVYDFPKRHEFYLGLWLRLDAQGGVDTVPVPETAQGAGAPLDAVDREIIAATQGGLPLVEEPIVALAERLDLDAWQVAGHLQAMLDSGAIRRIGAIPNHYRLGLRGNGMTVWDVPDEEAVALGERVGALDFVSHSYLRPRHPGVWPYNLFAMVHGRGRDEVNAKYARIATLLGGRCRAHDILFSSEVLKTTGLRLAA